MKKRFVSVIALILAVATLLGTFPIITSAADSNREYFPKYSGKSSSIVTVLKAIGVNSSFNYRKLIASKNGIANYSGTSSQNLKLVSLAKSGKLKDPSYTPPVSGSNSHASGNTSSSSNLTAEKYYPKYTGKSGSISTALKSMGINHTYAYREKIAKANAATTGVLANYKGSAAQNSKMPSLLKSGKLIRADYVEKSSECSQSIPTGDFQDIKTKTSIKSQPYEASATVVKISKGETVRVESTVKNSYGNKWYKVIHYSKDGVKEGYIYSGHMTPHTHHFDSFEFDEIEYSVCSCGKTTAYSRNPAKAKEGAIIVQSSAIAIPLTVTVAGELLKLLIEASIIMVSVCIAHDITITKKDHVNTLADALEDIKKREKDTCSLYSFRTVIFSPTPNHLVFTTNKCMSLKEAYAYILATGGNVYTYDQNAARELAAMWGCGIGERDTCNIHYKHYHLCEKNLTSNTCNCDKFNGGYRYPGHIFFGKNDLGLTPLDPYALKNAS